ncbi:MAG: EAL domain-containing protein [Rhodoferax sp.]|nr:EAL domain-containing protein [Rhodoferax sp.]MBP9734971.1 EAL domain-containing protein [Rhodoferax sp.]
MSMTEVLQRHAWRVLAQLDVPVMTLDLSGYLTSWNRGAEQLFGYTSAEAIGQHVLFLYADEPAGAETQLAEVMSDTGETVMEVWRRKKSGENFKAVLKLSMLVDDVQQAIGMVAQLSEIGEALHPDERQMLHSSIIEDSDQGILITDVHERIVSVNAAFSRITGYAAHEALGQTTDLLRSGVHDADFRGRVLAAMQGDGPWQGEIVGKRKNGELFPQTVSISVVRDDQGQVTHAFSIFSDISVLRATEARMQHLANFDSLTGLPNRAHFHRLVDQGLATARRTESFGALLAIDLQRFTTVNETFGHAIGDDLLRQVAQRFRQSLREEDVVARVGADEFVVALLSIQRREHAGIVAQKLLAALKPGFNIASVVLHVGASIGISVFPEDGMETASLLQFADVATKRLKTEGDAGYLFYSPTMNQRAKERWAIEGELRQALADGDLLLHYQPKVSLRNGRIVGAEALIRWRHPQRGMISPAHFIPVAEETGLILELGDWVADEACRQIRAWRDAGLNAPLMSINLSARQFDELLPSRILATLDRHGLPPSCLQLEITESLLVRGTDGVVRIMNELVAIGLTLSMDDFGTGYSSLAYLKKFPITALKIDRSFVIGLPGDDDDCAIARAIVTMAQQLRQEIVAEGVETTEQMQFLRSIGCDQMQGFLFSPAVPPDELARMVREDVRLGLR